MGQERGPAGRQRVPGELRRNLRALLPPHMIPSEFILLPSLPLTPNGKLDVRALPVTPKRRPATSARRRVRGAGRRDLARGARSRRPRTANFLMSGAARCGSSKCRFDWKPSWGCIPLADLFANPTIEAMGTLIGRGRPSAQDTQRSAAERAARAQAGKPSGRRGR